MARKADKYVIGILFTYEDRTEIKYVTKSDNINKISYWEDGKEAMTFSKDDAKYLAWALTINGNPAIPMLKADYLTLQNPKTKEEDEEQGEISIEDLIYKISKELDLDPKGIDDLRHDLNNLRGNEWLEWIEEKCSEDTIKKFETFIENQ